MADIWVLTGPKSGDNAQVLKAAEASGLPFEVRHVTLKQGHLSRKPAVKPSLGSIDLEHSDKLSGPWPKVVIAIGRHLSCVALWIKEQSGGATRIALFNAPKGRIADFDLIVLPPYYRLPRHRNVLPIRAPLIGIDPVQLAHADAHFADTLGKRERPLHALLVGGDMGQRKLKPRFAVEVLRQMREGFAADGSIHIATSRRTPAAVVNALAADIRPQDQLHRWQPGAQESAYLGLLAHADSFTVTADSLSMLYEVARLGRPLVIAEPPPPTGLAGLLQRASDLLRPRDLGQAVRLLCDAGIAVPLGQPPRPPRGKLPDETARVGQSLRQLAGVDLGPHDRASLPPSDLETATP